MAYTDRRSYVISSVISDTAGGIAKATALNATNFAGMAVKTPAGATAQTLSVYWAETKAGTYVPAIGQDGDALTFNNGSNVAASNGYEASHGIWVFPWIKIVAGSSQQTGLVAVLVT